MKKKNKKKIPDYPCVFDIHRPEHVTAVQSPKLQEAGNYASGVDCRSIRCWKWSSRLPGSCVRLFVWLVLVCLLAGWLVGWFYVAIFVPVSRPVLLVRVCACVSWTLPMPLSEGVSRTYVWSRSEEGGTDIDGSFRLYFLKKRLAIKH